MRRDEESEFEALVECFGYVVVAGRLMGRGRWIVVSDCQFLWNSNFKSPGAPRVECVRLLSNLVRWK
jgi:hypothetical protein